LPIVLRLPIYLDNQATTRTDPRVVEAMLPYFTTIYGNSASLSHRYGWDAAAAVDRAREQIAEALGAEPKEIVLTSGATEANNLALKGAVPHLKRRGNHLVTAATEHKAVLDPLRRLAREGWDLTIVPCDPHGLVSAEAIAAALTDRTVLVSVMAANNEVGTLNPLAAIGRLCHDRGILFHTDATQAVGKVLLAVQDAGIDLLSLSAHKIYGPKGVGALYVRRRDPPVRLAALFDGGGHERGFRSGTVAVPLAVGLGEAAALAVGEREAEAVRLRALRDRLHAGIAGRVPATRLNGHPTEIGRASCRERV
jgi:cysteine desulfurase